MQPIAIMRHRQYWMYKSTNLFSDTEKLVRKTKEAMNEINESE
jgi:hypothetical protein